MLYEERLNTKNHFDIAGDFQCKNYEPLDNFIKDEAFRYNENGQGNTFVILDKTKENIICFYTLRTNSLMIENEYIPLIELSRFAVHVKYSRQGNGTKCMLENIIPKVQKIKEDIGFMGILVFAETPESLAFYKYIGFIDFGVYEHDKNAFLVTDDGFNEGCHVLILKI